MFMSGVLELWLYTDAEEYAVKQFAVEQLELRYEVMTGTASVMRHGSLGHGCASKGDRGGKCHRSNQYVHKGHQPYSSQT